ncbi:MAG: hydantoinase/oxoprolinase family protein [Gemmatimonadetes bacterium]|nr:hydantoinase/oxoprolinase family protein [Gemmatimonadota bacterium]
MAARLTFAADTGGTFTDLVVNSAGGAARLYKRPTTPADPVIGLFDTLGAAADDMNSSVTDLLERSDLFVFGTTLATNAIVTSSTARTALLISEGHPDILLLREGGGRRTLFDYSQEYPEPYIPRALTFEIRERLSAEGEVLTALDERQVLEVIARLRESGVEAVAVCLLWSIINDEHETRIGELLAGELPDVPYTLSSRLNPSVREYRRASSTAIDASLKPLMSRFFRHLEEELRSNGFTGRLLIMTSSGGVLDAGHVAETPIHSIGSGPAGAPVAGRHFAALDGGGMTTAIVTDAGGTTFDVSVLRGGEIPTTRETMVGDQKAGYITGFPSVDVRSVGAGGGSIAWVDSGGMLHVGPISAGADPGPACYKRGGDRPTVTDACLVLGYLDPDYFLGGEIEVAIEPAADVITRHVVEPLGLNLNEAASAILTLATERMVTAIEEITLNQGIDPRQGLLIGGGGGGGLYCTGIAHRLGCWPVLIPSASAALSATGAMLSDLRATYTATELMSARVFDRERANAVLDGLHAQCREFCDGPGAGSIRSEISFSVEARYQEQVWEIEVPLARPEFNSDEDITALVESFHDTHDALFAVRDTGSDVEVLTWVAHVSCALQDADALKPPSAPGRSGAGGTRKAYFPVQGVIDTPVYQVQDLETGRRYPGPLLVESPVTTLVVDARSEVARSANESLLIYPLE